MIIRKAQEKDREAILEVMKPWNMLRFPSPEMEELDIDCFFVAEIDARIVGASGYKLLDSNKGKTTLLSVSPDIKGKCIGKVLQDKRLEAM